MSGITSGIGLISGINTAQLIDQLMALEARPIQNLQTRVRGIDARRAAFLDLSARLMAIRNAVTSFHQQSFFKRFLAASSNENVLIANASEDALPGTATLRVHSLVTNHALLTRGFADANRTPIGVGTITVESAAARVDRSTDLDLLNGGRGVRRGVIRITDRSGASADIDLGRAFTIDDVLEAINTNPNVSVRAHVTALALSGPDGPIGDRIVLEDFSGGTGSLAVADLNGGFAAADLGIAATVPADRIDGTDLLRLDMGTSLSVLNDGNGIDRLRQGATADDLVFTTGAGSFGVSLGDVLQLDTDLRAVNSGNGVRLGVIRITDRTGAAAEIDLSTAATISDVRDAINNAGLAVTATTVNSRMLITDTSTVSGELAEKLKIEDVSGHAAADLGILAEVDGNSINGRDVYRVATVGDLVRAINYAAGNNGQIEAAISGDGKALQITAAPTSGSVTVTAGVDSTGVTSEAAANLGILNLTLGAGQAVETQRLIGGLNTTLLHNLNGGAGIGAGVVSFSDAAGRSTVIDFSAAKTLRDVIDLINADDATSLSASVNTAGNGIVIRDDSGVAGPVAITDESGTLAADLHIAGTFDSAAESGNLQRQYVSRRTLLADLNGGNGVGSGIISITSTTGGVYRVNIGANIQTVGEAIDAINLVTPDNIHARINDRGDGILIEDTAGGAATLTIADEDGRVARSLRLARAAGEGQAFIDGSFEATVEIGASDTLAQIAEKLNASGANIAASVISDGGAVNPYSLTLSSTVSGRGGAVLIDVAGLDLGLATLTEAQDALVSVGTGGGAASMLIASRSNTLENVLPGVSINLLSARDEDVTVTTEQDMDGIVESIQAFVDAYNDLQGKLDDYTSFNSETLARGTLFADATVDQIRRRMQRAITQPFEGVDASISRLFTVGLRLGAENRLEFDEQRFREAYEDSPDAVEDLFTTAETGFGVVLQGALDDITRTFDGVLARKDDLLGDQQELLNDRIERMNVFLAAKRRRLEAQFAALESTLAGLQDQQNALVSLAQLAAGSQA